ncbi:Zinc/iron permease [Ascodesmis nigricans]|uniref:Zinc/iron permease n=1 Tax=Ascodesmis nigricans TaxID=341454 RepID=A0A4S2N581_9PEZI|nr:Zinc/iron permease [Ascodesmis nigricans]
MADGLFTVLLLGLIMAIASFAAGMLPLAVSLSQNSIRLLSTIGMGVLVGTSLTVIIPEGIETLYSVPTHREVARSPPSTPNQPNAQPVAGEVSFDLEGRSVHVLPSWVAPRSASPEAEVEALPIPQPASKPVETPHDHSDSDSDDDDHDHDHNHSHNHSHDEEEENGAHKWVGLSLIAGFILMYLIDVLPSTNSKGMPEPHHIALDNLRSISPPPASSVAARPNSLTLGLVIHSAADGIALGASSTAENTALSAIIFLAIMLHKAPAAFGLTSVLLRSGMGKPRVRNHLLIFSFAAPLGALVTWALVAMFGGGGVGMHWWTGVLLLFSGGTFLYVAMHTMQDHLTEYGQTNGFKEVGAAVFGMVIPLATQIGHHHHH